MGRLSPVTVIFLILLMLSGCAVNPVTGKTELALVGEAWEIDVGESQYRASQQAGGGLYQVDPGLTSYVNDVGQRLAAVSDRPLPYEFVVLNSSDPNAWALPGGKIAVNRGLLLAMESEAELAAVLAHEIVHAAARHGAKSIERGLLFDGVLIATQIAAEDSQYANYIVGGAGLGARLMTQRYGREAELESDYYGIQYMAAAGYDPGAAIKLQETFVRLSEGRSTSWLEGLFASHPPSRARVAANRQTVAAMGLQRPGQLVQGRERYKEKTAYLRSKNTAYQQFDLAGKESAKGNHSSALTAIRWAISIEPKEARFYGRQGDILLQQGRYTDALRLYGQAIEQDAGYYEYYLGRGLAFSKQGQRSAARQDLLRSNDLLPTAIAMNELGQLALVAGDRRGAKAYFAQGMGAGGAVGDEAKASFIRLDLPDNPNKYLRARPLLLEGRLVAEITNTTSQDIARSAVTFDVVVNGDQRRRTVSSGALSAGQKVRVDSGFRFRDSDAVDTVTITVERVSL